MDGIAAETAASTAKNVRSQSLLLAALPLLHRSFIFSQSLLLHRDDSRNSIAIDGDLEVHGHGAVDPFAASRILDVVIMLEAGGVTVVLRFLGEPDVAANRGAPRGPARVIRFDVAPDRVDRFPAFFKKVDGWRIEGHSEIDVVRFVAGDEVVHEFIDPNRPRPVVPRCRPFLIRLGRAR